MVGNNFSRLHRGDFESVPQVRLLVLDDSRIEEIEEDALGRMDLLEQLSLNGNQLASIPASLPSTSLSALHLEANRITALQAGDFVGLRRLDQLHLAHNVIVSIATGTFDQLTRLVELSLFLPFSPSKTFPPPFLRQLTRQRNLLSRSASLFI